MTINNSIADDLIYGQKNISSTSDQDQVSEDNISSARVESTRYKIYLLLFTLIGIILFYQFVLPTYDNNKISEQILDAKQNQVDGFQREKQVAENNVKLIKSIKEDEKKFLECINIGTGCVEYSSQELELIKDYLNISSLENDKMRINEKKILTNLNEFLLKKADNSGEYNGSFEAVFIGEEEQLDNNIYFSPLNLRIEFDNKNDLLSFVDNIEKRVLEDPEYRIMYQIDNIKYDILKSQEKQSVELNLYMFYTRA